MSRRVLIAEAIGDDGLALLAGEPGLEVWTRQGATRKELLDAVSEVEALIVRSATRVDAELLAAATRLQVVVRAGAGIDNIDLDAATARGVVVMNTPGGNTNAATEHTLALLLALARRIPLANRSLLEGRWEREPFTGFELMGKTLGVVGLGRIGSAVAERARAFKMEVAGYDPYVSREIAAARGIELFALDALLARADVVTLHLPLAGESRHLIGARELALMKPGARLINCARGGLVDEAALLAALEAGHIGGAALDVFESEPRPEARLIAHPHVVATPHLGASTFEAQASVGIQAARQVLGVLNRTSFENAVNMPIRDPALLSRLGPWLVLAERMGAFQAQMAEGGLDEVRLEIAGDLDDGSALSLAYLKGLLGPVHGDRLNYVNAPYLARERGIRVTESRGSTAGGYTTLLTTSLVTRTVTLTMLGTVFSGSEPRLVGIDGFRIEAIPEGHLLLCRSLDRPGVIGQLGQALGIAGLNISEFRLGRRGPGQEALALLTLDSEPAAAVLTNLRALENVLAVRYVRL